MICTPRPERNEPSKRQVEEHSSRGNSTCKGLEGRRREKIDGLLKATQPVRDKPKSDPKAS